MGRIAGIRRWLHLDRGVSEEIEEELAFHFEQATDDLVARGMSREAARLEVQRRFGNLSHYRHELELIDEQLRLRDRLRDRVDELGRMLRQAWRGLWRRPSFTVLVAVTLGLGIGVNAALFGVLDRLMVHPPALVREPGSLVRLYVQRDFLGRQTVNASLSYQDIRDFERVAAFSGVAAVHSSSFTMGRGLTARRIPANLVSPEFFSLLGVPAILGRTFSPADDSLTATTAVAVISYGLWQREFGGDRSVLGRTMELGDGRYRVIGVAPKGFTGASPEQVDVWLPIRSWASEMISGPWETSRGISWLRAVARLAPGVTPAQAEAEATAVHRAARETDAYYDHQARILAGPLLEARGPDSPPEARVSLWIAGVSLIVLLVACANVTNLLLFRAIRRRRETAVRLALGIGRGRLIGELLLESILLALVAGTAGTVLAAWGSEAIRQLLFPQLAWATTESLSWRVLGFTALASLTAGLLSGLIPAWLESRPDLLASLKEGGAHGGTRRSIIRSGLVVIQAALSVPLLVGAGLFLRSFHRVQSLDLGMQPEHVLLATPDFPRETTPARATEVYQSALARFAAMPGVAEASYSTVVPFRGNWAEELTVPDLDSLPSVQTGGPYVDGVSPGYFATLGIPIVRGRGFTPGDGPGAARVAVVGQTMARMLWPDQEPLGKCLKIGGDTMPCSEVVGIARDALRNSLVAGERMQYYIPLAQFPGPITPQVLFLRTRGNPVEMMGPVRSALMELAPEVRWVNLEPLQSLVDPEFRSWRLGATLFTVFGALALLVAAIGLYSLLSYDVASRSQEIGVRTALGAQPAGIIALVARDGVRLVAGGLLVGLLAALLTGGALRPLLFRTSPAEPGIYLGVAAVLLLIAVLAGALPALRATRVSPITALRAD
jgi:putative ABC transport system permease protein